MAKMNVFLMMGALLALSARAEDSASADVGSGDMGSFDYYYYDATTAAPQTPTTEAVEATTAHR